VPPALQFVVFLVALVALWAVVTRPTRQQQRRVASLQAEIAIGDEVILSAGIFGTVRSIEDDRVLLEIAEDTVITVARQVVVRRAPDEQDHQQDPQHPDAHHPED
jgi:preprotein translocase subunit YajC